MSGSTHLVIAPEIMLAGALLAGLAAAYGRELHLGRSPGWRWWFSMLLLLPSATISSEVVSDALSLTGKVRILVTVLTILRGYDGLTILEKHWQLTWVRLPRSFSRGSRER